MSAAFKDLIRNRRTVHSFAPGVPPRALIVDAIEAASWAPNHRLTEPWRFYLLGPQTAAAIAQLNAALVTASKGAPAGAAKLERWLGMPGHLVVTCSTSDDPLREREDYAACCCAIQNLQLVLWSEGVGMKWTTGAVVRESRFLELIGADPATESVVGMFWYGYPAEVPRMTRKPIEAIVKERP